MRHKLTNIVFTQGWLGGQLESMLEEAKKTENENPTPALIAAQIVEHWKMIDEALDDLIKERGEMERKLSIVESAFVK